MKSIQCAFFFVSLFMVVGCRYEVETNMNSDEFKNEANLREIRRFTESEIVDAAYKVGANIADSLYGVQGAESAAMHCNEVFNGKSGERFQRIKVVCDSSQITHDKELAVWQAYQYNLQSGSAMRDNIQNLSQEKQFVFTRPVLIGSDSVKLAMISILFDKKDIIVGM